MIIMDNIPGNKLLQDKSLQGAPLAKLWIIPTLFIKGGYW